MAPIIHDDQKGREELDTLLLEGIASGDPVPVDAEFWTDLKQEALAKLQAGSGPQSLP